jgi:3-oxoacyl-[acyl-carrier-protein] synthase II
MAGPDVRRRVVVTGIGAVTPLGDLSGTRRALAEGRRAPTGRSRYGGPAPAAEVRDFDARPHFRIPKALKLTDRRTQMAVAAASMAMADAGAGGGGIDPERLGVVIGSSGSDLQAEDLARATADPEHRAAEDIPFFAERILSGLNPLWLLVNLPNMASAHVAIQLDARGPNSTVMTDWIAGAQAIGEGAGWIRSGEADAVLAGGADVGILPFALASYEQAELFRPDAGLPEPFTVSEGAAVLLLEEAEHAARRGARIYGELAGYACACAPPEEGALAVTMAQAAAESGIAPERVCCASVFRSPHWEAERDAVAAVVRGREAVLEFRSSLGHSLGASGAIDAALALAAVPEGSSVLVNALGFLGQAATIAFSRRAA